MNSPKNGGCWGIQRWTMERENVNTLKRFYFLCCIATAVSIRIMRVGDAWWNKKKILLLMVHDPLMFFFNFFSSFFLLLLLYSFILIYLSYIGLMWPIFLRAKILFLLSHFFLFFINKMKLRELNELQKKSVLKKIFLIKIWESPWFLIKNS